VTEDDAPTPAPDTAETTTNPATTNPATADPVTADPGARRRRRLIAIGGGLAALVILATCAGGIALIVTVDRLADRADDNERSAARTYTACLDLERRLNRLSPPGAAADPRGRATAVRNENAAIRPFLTELEQLPGDGDEHRRDWIEAWRQLADARTAYADALDRQATGGEPAFFVAPQGRRGKPVVERLGDAGPESCDGAIRRLAGPDL
jgi:hypothetical protein